MENPCAMIPQGLNEPCKRRRIKDGIYCKYHNYIMKKGKSKVKLCLRCNKGTTAKLRICDKCGGKNEREIQRYFNVIKPRREMLKKETNVEC